MWTKQIVRRIGWLLALLLMASRGVWAWEPDKTVPTFRNPANRDGAVQDCKSLIGMSATDRAARLKERNKAVTDLCGRKADGLTCRAATDLMKAAEWSVDRINAAKTETDAKSVCSILEGAPVEHRIL